MVGLPEDAGDAAAFRGEIVARLHQTELRDREALVQHRAVLAGHTYGHRVDELLTAIGGTPPARDRSVSAIVPTNRAHEIDRVLANLGRQAHDDVELVLVLHGLDLHEADLRARAAEHGVRHLTVVAADSTLTLGACLNLRDRRRRRGRTSPRWTTTTSTGGTT